jgi:hypothetical protein
MMIFPRRSYPRKDLAALPPDQKQDWVNDLYSRPLHEMLSYSGDPSCDFSLREVYYPGLGATHVSATVSEVIEFCPPELAAGRGIDLANPPFLPIWVCHGNGKNVPVYTPEELAQELGRQPQCYGPTPEGLWSGDAADPWPYTWDPGKGLFAPSPYGSNAPGGPQAVFTRCPLVYHGRAIFVGALFLLEDSFTDEDLLSKGIVREVKPYDYASTSEHTLTHWWFMNKSLQNDYARRYKDDDHAGIQWIVHPEPDTEPTPKAEDAAQAESFPKRKRTTVIKYSNREYFIKLLGDVVDALRKKIRNRDPHFDEISLPLMCLDENPWPDGMSKGTLRERLNRHKIDLEKFLKERPWSPLL